MKQIENLKQLHSDLMAEYKNQVSNTASPGNPLIIGLISRAHGIEDALKLPIIQAAPELLEALKLARIQIIELLNEGDFKRSIELDLGYIVDAVAKAEGKESA